MKTLLSLAGGAVLLTEQAGEFVLSFDETLSVGGGQAAGIIKIQGKGSVILSGAQAFHLLTAVINSHVPAPLLGAVQAGEALAEAAIAKA